MRKVGIAAGIVMTAVCFFLAVRFGMLAQQSADIATTILAGQALSAAQAEEIGEKEAGQERPQGHCFWGEIPKTPLLCRETGAVSTVKTVLCVGNPELIVPGSGAVLYRENGCFIDTGTAQQLFGTKQAAGQTVWCGDDSYVVCGTFEGVSQMLLRQAAEADGEALDRISFSLSGSQPERQSSTAGAGQFLMRYSLSGETIDYLFINALVNDLLLILPLMVCIWFVRYFVSNIPEHKVYLLLAAAASAAAVWFFMDRIQIPADMIPTKWSDFSFWTAWWESQRRNLLLVLGSAQGEVQLSMLWNLLASFLCNVCAVFLGVSLRSALSNGCHFAS